MALEHHEEYCVNESRIATIEAQLKNKRYDLNELKENLEKQSVSITNLTNQVTRLATILEENQSVKNEQGDKIDTLEIQITTLNSTLTTLKWVLTIAVAMFGGLILFLITELIKLIH